MERTRPGAEAAIAGARPSQVEAAGSSGLRPDDVAGARARLASALAPGGLPRDAAALVDLLGELEELKSVACAAQAAAALALDGVVRAAEAAHGVPAPRRGESVAQRVALARKESGHRGRALLGAAKVWATEMPHTYAALGAGVLSEYRAMILVRETACLPVAARREIDALVCADRDVLAGVGTRRLTALARGHATRLDPAALAARARRAEAERAVWIRPAPDTMTYVTALLPVAQGVGVFAALTATADAARATGDPRSRGQLMADTFVERVTGRERAADQAVTVNLIVSDATLLTSGPGAGFVDGYGPVPAQVARTLVARGLDAGAAWLRRIYADPAGSLVAASTAARFHAPGLAALLRVRDQGLCRTPYCDAPIRHLDHVVPDAEGGPTDRDNSQGLCEACNYVKESAGLESRRAIRQKTRAGPGRHTVVTTTDTGHRYAAAAPPAPAPAEPARRARSGPFDLVLAHRLAELAA